MRATGRAMGGGRLAVAKSVADAYTRVGVMCHYDAQTWVVRLNPLLAASACEVWKGARVMLPPPLSPGGARNMRFERGAAHVCGQGESVNGWGRLQVGQTCPLVSSISVVSAFSNVNLKARGCYRPITRPIHAFIQHPYANQSTQPISIHYTCLFPG